MWSRIVFLVPIWIFGNVLFVQELPSSGYEEFLRANEMFGRKVIAQAHAEHPDSNIAFSPLPISITFSAIEGQAWNEELLDAMGWKNLRFSEEYGRMIAAAFRKPISGIPSSNGRKKKPASGPFPPGLPSELWVSSDIWFRGMNYLAPRFLQVARDDFKMKLHEANGSERAAADRECGADGHSPQGKLRRAVDLCIVTNEYLRTNWASNLFSYRDTKPSQFHLRDGRNVQAQMMQTEIGYYRHHSNAEREVVELEGSLANLVVVLPADGVDILELEKQIIDQPDLVGIPAKKELGRVNIPKFSFKSEVNVRKHLEQLGVKRIFGDYTSLRYLVTNPEGAKLNSVDQSVDISVNEDGIVAGSKTITGVVYGGIFMTNFTPFQMTVNRPFLFFVRDNATRSLLFVGATMDPTVH